MIPPAADVVIATYNARAQVSRCLAALELCEGIASISVVDDVSSDGTVAALGDAHPDARIIALEAHRGLAYALNQGASAGEAEYVLFLNNDVLAEPCSVRRLLDALAADASAVSAGGRLVEPRTRSTQLDYQPRQIPGLVALLVRLLGIERLWPRNPWTGQHRTAPLDQSGRQRTDRQPAGACLMVRRSALKSVGGWDERYGMWYEDVDLSRRLARVGPALYVPDAMFEHVGRASTRSWRKHEQHLRLYHSTMIYAQTHLSRTQQVVVALTMIGVCVPRLLVHAVRNDEATNSYLQLVRTALGMCKFMSVGTVERGTARPSPSPARR